MGLSFPAAFFQAQKPTAATASTSTASTIGFLFMAPLLRRVTRATPAFGAAGILVNASARAFPNCYELHPTGLQLRLPVTAVFQAILPCFAAGNPAELDCGTRVEQAT